MAIGLQTEAPSSFTIIWKSLELNYPYKQLIRESQTRLWGKKSHLSVKNSHTICYSDIPWVSFNSFSCFPFTGQAERQIACKSKPFPICLQKDCLCSVVPDEKAVLENKTLPSEPSQRHSPSYVVRTWGPQTLSGYARGDFSGSAPHPGELLGCFGFAWFFYALHVSSVWQKASLFPACICYTHIEERVKIFKCWGTCFSP